LAQKGVNCPFGQVFPGQKASFRLFSITVKAN